MNNGKWTGKCLQCGKCCNQDINWIYFSTEERKNKAIEWAIQRGYTIKNVFNNLIQAEFTHKCNNLTEDNKCKLHYNKKPDWCKEFPLNIEEDENIYDINKILPDGCGFKYIYE